MEFNKVALQKKYYIVTNRGYARNRSERVPFSLFFVVCSVFLNSEQFQKVQDENDCRKIRQHKQNKSKTPACCEGDHFESARVFRLLSTVLAQAADHNPMKEYNKGKFYHVLYHERQISC